MKKILFVNPSQHDDVMRSVRILSLPPLNLALLAGLTPSRYEVRIVDETVEEIPFDDPWDLVAITCVTPLAPRAYAIGQRFGDLGVPVVIGGVHTTMMPDEAGRYADAVVVGEAEGVWHQLLQDWEAKKLQRRYRADRPSLADLPHPRLDLLSGDYFVKTVQTSRGCPFDCSFCSVTRFNGGKYRFRPIEDVIAEIHKVEDSRFFFVDDNIIGAGQQCLSHARSLFDRLEELNKQWASQICINIAGDEQLLKAAYRAGARFFFIGFESTESETLAAMNKKINLRARTKDFTESIKRIRGCGIAVAGGFIFGNDTDKKDVFDKTVEFVDRSQIDAVQLTVQTPFPGTALYEQLSRENRLTMTNYPDDWRRHNAFEVVFEPKQMTARELVDGHVRAYRSCASLGKSLLRGAKTLFKTKSLLGTAASFSWSHGCYKAVRANAKRHEMPALSDAPHRVHQKIGVG